ncbi:MAG: glycosyltransferase family 2 protein [Stigonema ocellatum SAG 48.90 = DSM 106950]|nr:glycosyltransferase family 2 protein [Stigonema ocellatum SAG 48.90 = DSM 106950]
MAPLVSIILPCYNRATYLEKCVKSVLEQTFPDLECILIDDGSTDNTREIAERLMNVDSRVKYFFKENGGLSSARNFGIQNARGYWIQCLDPDDWIHEDKTRFQLSYLSELESQEVIFYCDYERVYLDNDQNIIKREENIVGLLTREELIQRLLLPDFLANSPFPLLQQCLLIKKDIFTKKIFDNRLKALQDRDFALDLLNLDVNFVYTPIVGSFYTKHQTNMSNQGDLMKQDYILFYEIQHNKHQNMQKYCLPALEFLIDEAIQEKDKNTFDRLSRIVQFPIHLLSGKIKLNNVISLRLAYSLRLIIPNFILYKKYRGPRSKKIMSILSRLPMLVKSN